MKIDSSNTPVAFQISALRVTSKTDVQGAGSVQQTSAASAKVSLSSVSALHEASGSDIDVAKVASIKAALRDGTYKIDSGKIASGMLSSASDLLKTAVR